MRGFPNGSHANIPILDHRKVQQLVLALMRNEGNTTDAWRPGKICIAQTVFFFTLKSHVNLKKDFELTTFYTHTGFQSDYTVT